MEIKDLVKTLREDTDAIAPRDMMENHAKILMNAKEKIRVEITHCAVTQLGRTDVYVTMAILEMERLAQVRMDV